MPWYRYVANVNQASCLILDLCLRKSRNYQGTIGFLKCFSSSRKRKAFSNVFKFLWFDQCFRKATFSWQICKDSRPNRKMICVFKHGRACLAAAAAAAAVVVVGNLLWRSCCYWKPAVMFVLLLETCCRVRVPIFSNGFLLLSFTGNPRSFQQQFLPFFLQRGNGVDRLFEATQSFKQ